MLMKIYSTVQKHIIPKIKTELHNQVTLTLNTQKSASPYQNYTIESDTNAGNYIKKAKKYNYFFRLFLNFMLKTFFCKT